jgi:hypothetical protein
MGTTPEGQVRLVTERREEEEYASEELIFVLIKVIIKHVSYRRNRTKVKLKLICQ